LKVVYPDKIYWQGKLSQFHDDLSFEYNCKGGQVDFGA